MRASLDPISAQGVWDHYINYGAAEGRAPNSWFDAEFYFEENPDLLNAGLNWSQLLDHFYEYGAREGRSPNPDIDSDSWLDYALAPGNADLRAAYGIDEDATELTDEQVGELTFQFFRWGIDEGREAAPITGTSTPGETFNLTPAIDTLTGTPGDDVFNAYAVNPADGEPITTLNGPDSINGGGGSDTLNIYNSLIDGTAYNTRLDSQTTIKNIETVNIFNDENTGAFYSEGVGAGVGYLDVSRFEGVELINQVGGAVTNLINLDDGVVARFSDLVLAGEIVHASESATSATIQLDNVRDAGTIPAFDVKGAEGSQLSDVNVSGSLAHDIEKLGLNVYAGKGVSTVTLNSGLNTKVALGENADGGYVNTLDASVSTGNLTVDSRDEDNDALMTILTGSGDDEIFIDDVNPPSASNTLTIDTGIGDDLVLLGADLLDSQVRLDIDLGEGDDILARRGRSLRDSQR